MAECASIKISPAGRGLSKHHATARVRGIPSLDEKEVRRRFPQNLLVVLDGPVNLETKQHRAQPEHRVSVGKLGGTSFGVGDEAQRLPLGGSAKSGKAKSWRSV